jgi:hypothetical protein
MWKLIKLRLSQVFSYISNIWLGADGKLSVRAVLALCFSYDIIRNTSFAIRKWEIGKSYADVAILIGIEAGLVVSLLGLTAITNMVKNKLDAQTKIQE